MDAIDSSGYSFPKNTISPRLNTLINLTTPTSHQNNWILRADHFETSSVIVGYVSLPNDNSTLYVLKYLSYSSHPNGKAMRELESLNKASKSRLAPKIIDAWTSLHGISIVMEKLEIDLEKLILMYKSLEVRTLIMDSVYELFNSLHQIGMLHGDGHLGNIMVISTHPKVKSSESESEMDVFKSHGYSFYFIDFGDSTPLGSDIVSLKIKRDYNVLRKSLMELAYDYRSADLLSLCQSM